MLNLSPLYKLISNLSAPLRCQPRPILSRSGPITDLSNTLYKSPLR